MDAANQTRFQAFNRQAWLRQWYMGRGDNPLGLIPRVPQPLEPGETVYVVARTTTPFPNASASMRWALCLVSAELTERTATRLATTLALVHNLHGLDAQEGLAFLVQLYLLFVEQYRASQGQQSLLFDAKWVPYGTSFQDFWHCLPAITDYPVWELLEVLEYWTYFGAQVTPGVMYGRDHAEGRLWHLMIPPIWVSLEKLRGLSDQHAESLKIPMLVPPTLKALTEHFIGFYSLHAQTQGPLSLIFQPAERTSNKDDSAPLGTVDCDFKHMPDYRSVKWRGEDLSFTPDQAIIIKALHEAYKNGTPEVGQRHLFEQADRQSNRLRDLFRSKHAKDIWGRFVIPGKTRGTYRLNLP